jgi:hypothetical protein
VWNVRRLKHVLTDMEVLRASDGRASQHVAHMTEAVDPTMTLLVSKLTTQVLVVRLSGGSGCWTCSESVSS